MEHSRTQTPIEMTLEEVKESISVKNGYPNWECIINERGIGTIESLMDEVAKRYAQSACEDLRERIAEGAKVNFNCNVWNCEGQSVNKDSIKNVEIILK